MGGAGTRQHVDGLWQKLSPENPGLFTADRDTSGILVVATTLPASCDLPAFQSHDHQKTYLAIVLACRGRIRG